MGFPVKKNRVKFCPFCGYSIVTHIGDDVFLCGHNDIEKEARLKFLGRSASCNKSFRVMSNHHLLLNGDSHCKEFRVKIGNRVSELRSIEVDTIGSQLDFLMNSFYEMIP